MDQEKAIEKYQKLQSFFRRTLKFFNFDYFNHSGDFRVRNMFFITTILCSYYFNIQKVLEYNKVNRIMWTLNMAWFLVHFMAIAKGFTLMYNKKEFLGLLQEIGELYSKEYSKPILEIQQRDLRENFKLTIVGLVAYGAIFWLAEFVTLGWLFTLPTVEFPLLYNIPIFLESPTYSYIFNMIWQFFIYFSFLSIISFGDLFIIFFGLHFRCELKIISEICETLLEDNDVVKSEKALLKEIYEKHMKVLNMLKTLDNIYRHLSFNHFITSFTVICSLFYAILVQEEFDGSIYILTFLGVTQLFVLCLFGETLVANTEQIGISVYLTKWYEMTTLEQMNLLFIMRIAQKPHGIKAAGLIDVNFFTFVEAMKAAVSYCAILYALTN